MYKSILYPVLFALIFLSCNNPNADKNYEHMQQIKKGMHLEKVLTIMGKPDTIFAEPENSNRIWYMYKSSVGMSDNFYIYISKKDSLVTGVNEGN